MITISDSNFAFGGDESILRQIEVPMSNDYDFAFTLDFPINVFVTDSSSTSLDEDDIGSEIGVENEAEAEEYDDAEEQAEEEEAEEEVEEEVEEVEEVKPGEVDPEAVESRLPTYRREVTDSSIVYLFDNVNDTIAHTDGTIFDAKRAKGAWRDEYLGRHLPSWEAIKDAMTQPWEEGLNCMMSLIEKIEDCELPEPKDKRRHTRFGHDDGDELDFDRLRGGQDYWRYSSRDDRPGPAEITIISATSISRYVDPMALLWNGAAAVALTKILEDHGYRVELWVADSCRTDDYSKQIVTATRLKSTLDPIDYSGFANAISAWFYRGVSIINHITIAKRETGKDQDHTYVSHYSEEDTKKITPDENVIELRNILSLESAVAFVKKQLEKLMEPANV